MVVAATGLFSRTFFGLSWKAALSVSLFSMDAENASHDSTTPITPHRRHEQTPVTLFLGWENTETHNQSHILYVIELPMLKNRSCALVGANYVYVQLIL